MILNDLNDYWFKKNPKNKYQSLWYVVADDPLLNMSIVDFI